MTKNLSLSGTALITGASKRIGRAIAIHLAQSGFNLALHYYRSEDEAKALASELSVFGVRISLLRADLSDSAAVQGLMAEAVKALGPIRVLINNASLFASDDIYSFSTASYNAHLSTNLLAPLLLSQAFAAQSDLPKDAAIINLIDQRVLNPSPDFFSYGLSKSALWHSTQTLAQALAPQIRVNAIGPGPTLQSIHQTADDFAKEAMATLLQKSASPDDVAEAVLFLINAKSITGQMICVDSGQHLS